MPNTEANVLIGGEAGQGLVTLSQILTRAIVRQGYYIMVTQSYHSRIRGGHNTYALRISTSPITAPKENVDILVALNKETVQLHSGELSAGGIIVLDEALEIKNESYVSVPFKSLSADKYWNAAAVGVVTEILGLEMTGVEKVAREFFSKHSPEHVDANMESFAAGLDWMKKNDLKFAKLASAELKEPRIMVNGNEAIALGALSIGMKSCFFYPMTPATSISMTICEHAQGMGVVAEQAEDEISAINMAIGASFCGSPSLVPTSGGGFALMAEGLSLAGMTETPVVIVLAQRPGPSTGLPTRTEQGDLEFALHAGHGEFPRAIFAPGSVEECFWLTRTAFETADEFKIPVILMTDQYLADCYNSVKPFAIDQLKTIDVCVPEPIEQPHLTYKITDSGISPRLLPGFSNSCVVAHSSDELVVADSDEHTENGHLTEDLSIRAKMVEKRNRKFTGLKSVVLNPESVGPDAPDLLLVSWGSTKGSVHEVCDNLSNSGVKAAYLHFSQIWPINSDVVSKILNKAKEVVCVESNSTGQFAKLLRRETGFHIEKTILRYDGAPITPQHIMNRLELGTKDV